MSTWSGSNFAAPRGVLVSCIAAALFGVVSPLGAAQVEDEEAIDKELGLLDHPWVIVVAASKTRLYLRSQAQGAAGLPAYDQQVESAQESPASLFQQLTSPAVEAPQTRSSSRRSRKDDDDDKPWQN